MIEPIKQLQSTLKDRALSTTYARKQVFMALLDKEPQTMNQIVSACPAIDRTSVYRTINLYERLGVAKRMQIGWKYKIELAGNFHSHHHHLTCMHCGSTTPFEEDPQLLTSLEKIVRQNDFEMREHQLEIQGLCKNCRPRFA